MDNLSNPVSSLDDVLLRNYLARAESGVYKYDSLGLVPEDRHYVGEVIGKTTHVCSDMREEGFYRGYVDGQVFPGIPNWTKGESVFMPGRVHASDKTYRESESLYEDTRDPLEIMDDLADQQEKDMLVALEETSMSDLEFARWFKGEQFREELTAEELMADYTYQVESAETEGLRLLALQGGENTTMKRKLFG